MPLGDFPQSAPCTDAVVWSLAGSPKSILFYCNLPMNKDDVVKDTDTYIDDHSVSPERFVTTRYNDHSIVRIEQKQVIRLHSKFPWHRICFCCASLALWQREDVRRASRCPISAHSALAHCCVLEHRYITHTCTCARQCNRRFARIQSGQLCVCACGIALCANVRCARLNTLSGRRQWNNRNVDFCCLRWAAVR